MSYRAPGSFTSFQYGYTLGPPTAANNGDYTVYNQYGTDQQQHQQQTSNNIEIKPTVGAPTSWADIKPKVDLSAYKAKVFVTATSTAASSSSASTSMANMTPNDDQVIW